MMLGTHLKHLRIDVEVDSVVFLVIKLSNWWLLQVSRAEQKFPVLCLGRAWDGQKISSKTMSDLCASCSAFFPLPSKFSLRPFQIEFERDRPAILSI